MVVRTNRPPPAPARPMMADSARPIGAAACMFALMGACHGLSRGQILRPLRSAHLTRAHRLRNVRACDSSEPDGDDIEVSLERERRKRGLLNAMEELEADGPSAFKSPHKVVEYVMLSLQHRGEEGIAEAFRFTSPSAGTQSFVHGVSTKTPRVSWKHGKLINRYVSGEALDLDTFSQLIREEYALLIECDVWRFARESTSVSEAATPEDRGWVVEYVLDVKLSGRSQLVLFRLLYDWGAWCYLVFNVRVLPDGLFDIDNGAPLVS